MGGGVSVTSRSSRPSSTVSYSRNDAPAYPPSPAVEQSAAAPVALTHSEAMERFNVSRLLAFGATSNKAVPESGEGFRGGVNSTAHAILSCAPSKS
jgi:hypothetical protein